MKTLGRFYYLEKIKKKVLSEKFVFKLKKLQWKGNESQ